MNSRLLMALATPLLMLLALLGLFGVGQRQGAERLQALPAVLIWGVVGLVTMAQSSHTMVTNPNPNPG